MNIDQEDPLNLVLAEYWRRVETGHGDRQGLLARHPELAEELAAYFTDHDQFDRLAGALRGLKDSSASKSLRSRVDDALLGETLGDFRLLREAGRGGMGVVYEAEQISVVRRVALKVLPFTGALDPRQLQRFKNEAQAAANLRHPHIVPVHALGHDRGVHYYVMEFIEGHTLAGVIRELQSSVRGTVVPDRGNNDRGSTGRKSSLALPGVRASWNTGR
jgi:hypothetical protein